MPIVAISFVGHSAVKVLGPSRGIPVTALFDGLSSSTATPLSLARLTGRGTVRRHLPAAGIVIAGATMFTRILLEMAAVDAGLFPQPAPALVTITIPGAAGAAALWWWPPEAAGRGWRPAQSP